MMSTSKSIALVESCLLALAAQMGVTATAMAQVAADADSKTPALMDRQQETVLALSACPPMVAGKAAVYVLDKSGYVKIRESQNGFTAIVQHSMPTSQEPQCMDTEGARTFVAGQGTPYALIIVPVGAHEGAVHSSAGAE